MESTQLVAIYGLSSGLAVNRIMDNSNYLTWTIDNTARTVTFTHKDGSSNIRMILVGNN